MKENEGRKKKKGRRKIRKKESRKEGKKESRKEGKKERLKKRKKKRRKKPLIGESQVSESYGCVRYEYHVDRIESIQAFVCRVHHLKKIVNY